MFKLIFYSILFTIISFAVFWLSQNTGEVIFQAFGYQVELAFVTAFLILVIFILFLQFLTYLIFKLSNISLNLRTYFTERKNNQILYKLNTFIESIASKELTQLKTSLKEAKNLNLPDKVITLFKYYLAKKQNDFKEIKVNLLKLSETAEFKVFSLKKMVKQALKTTEWDVALNYSDELLKLNEAEFAIRKSILAFYNLKKWQNMMHFLEQSKAHKYLNNEEYNNTVSFISYNIAQDAFLNKEYDKALVYGKKAIRLFPHIDKFHLLLAEILLSQSNLSDTIKTLKIAWKFCPSSMLTQFILKLTTYYTVEEFYEKVLSITKENPKQYESNILLGKAALISNQFKIASKQLAESLNSQQRIRACLLMAEFCAKTHGNSKEIQEWLNKAIVSDFDLTASKIIDFNPVTLEFK